MEMSDLQFVAYILAKTQRGDQVPRSEQNRLDDIAEHGYTTGKVVERPPLVLSDPALAGATRVPR